ncbi:hypothetical protein [Amycolatopsis aidingensis]|uniref:hypothetical protein n=1 Tax=Amycolatopsis aidingensis TaxID=2842453 RepID=UPI001C0E28E1|nr:hypothetical protein [Amycolatopsis aidingensis]
MEIVYDLLVVLHLLGMAGILSGLMTYAYAQTPKAFTIIAHSAATQLVTGVAMVGIASADLVGAEVNHIKIGVKLLIALIVLVLGYTAVRKQAASRNLLTAITLLTIANVAIAVIW